MNATHTNENAHHRLVLVMEVYVTWQGDVLRQVFYPGIEDKSRDIAPPPPVEELADLQNDLHESAARLLEASGGGKDVSVALFGAFMDLYDRFMHQLRRLEQGGEGSDLVTGLRAADTIIPDMAQEMERLARQGNPFCVVLAQIDHADRVRSLTGPEAFPAVLKKVAGLVKKCLRSFDDAYYAGRGEFVMSLKHTDSKGGGTVVKRLTDFLKEDPIILEENGKFYPLTLSCCVSEPVPEDRPGGILADMRADLARYQEDEERTLEHVEQSPLQRYVKGVGEGGDSEQP
ncbi:MAG: diguanylate cyclase [Alphaproteobacteria bacterium]|nr:diguanylate cyclase [Alphaproteobacteria bacterium]